MRQSELSTCRPGFDVSVKALPIEASLDQQELPVGQTPPAPSPDPPGNRIGLADEVLVLGILAGLGTVQQSQNPARRNSLNRYTPPRVLRRHPSEQRRGGERSRPVPRHSPDRGAADGGDPHDNQPSGRFMPHQSSITQPRTRRRALPPQPYVRVEAALNPRKSSSARDCAPSLTAFSGRDAPR